MCKHPWTSHRAYYRTSHVLHLKFSIVNLFSKCVMVSSNQASLKPGTNGGTGSKGSRSRSTQGPSKPEGQGKQATTGILVLLDPDSLVLFAPGSLCPWFSALVSFPLGSQCSRCGVRVLFCSRRQQQDDASSVWRETTARCVSFASPRDE